MKTRLIFCIVPLLCTGVATAETPLTDGQKRVAKVGDVLQYAIPAAAFAMTYVLKGLDKPSDLNVDLNTDKLIHLDGSPRHDLALALGRSVVVTEVLKFSFNETRPDGGRHSFPSGHTSVAFTGAEFIRKEYGWWWGAPAYAAAGFVGWSRVQAHEHFTRDVLAGAAIGILANHDLREFSTRHGSLSFAPTTMGVEARPVLGLQFRLTFSPAESTASQ